MQKFDGQFYYAFLPVLSDLCVGVHMICKYKVCAMI